MGVLPLIEENTLFCGFPVRMLRGAANVHSCRFDLLCASGPDGELAVKAIWESIKKDTTWDVIELPYVPSGGAAEQLLRQASGDGFLTGQIESDETPYIPNLQHSMLRSGHSHFQSNVRRRMRKAREQWPVRLNRVVTTDAAALERSYELESSGWKGKGKTAIACSPAIRRFYDAIAKAGAQAGYFSLYLLEFGDTVVAGHFGLAYNGHYYSPKVAYDERFAAYGPGHLIVDAILRDIADRKTKEWSWARYLETLMGEKCYRLFDPADPRPFFESAVRFAGRRWDAAVGELRSRVTAPIPGVPEADR